MVPSFPVALSPLINLNSLLSYVKVASIDCIDEAEVSLVFTSTSAPTVVDGSAKRSSCFCYHRQTWTYHTYRQECYKYLFNSSHVTYPFIFYYYLFRSFCRSSGSRSAACIISGRSTSCCCPFCSSGCSRSS